MRSGEHVVMKDLGLGRGFWTGHNNIIKKYKRRAHFGSTYTKIGMIQRLAWPLLKDDTQIRKAFHTSERGYMYTYG